MARIDIRSNGGGGGSVATGVLQLLNGVALDATLRSVTDQSNTISPLKLSTTAVQVNSPLRITTSDASGFYLDAEDSATNNRFSIKRDPSSQEVTLDFASNPSGSTSLVGAIRTYQDGVNLSNAMSFIEDGSVGIGTNTPIGILHLKRTAATTRMVMDGDAGQSKIITYRTAGLQRFGLYTNNTAESGSNAGSDFAIRAYNDAGTLLNTPVFIKRSTGNVGINTITGTAKLQVVGSGATSATTALLVQNSAGSAALTVRDDREVLCGAGLTVGNAIFADRAMSQGGGSGLINTTSFNSQQAYPRFGLTSDASVFYYQASYNPTSGSGAFAVFNATPTINQTGGANGITRGLYINPTLTAAFDFRAIETTAGKIILGGLPTSPVGLVSGQVWNNLGVLNIA
jgi:hypothetical protein